MIYIYSASQEKIWHMLHAARVHSQFYKVLRTHVTWLHMFQVERLIYKAASRAVQAQLNADGSVRKPQTPKLAEEPHSSKPW